MTFSSGVSELLVCALCDRRAVVKHARYARPGSIIAGGRVNDVLTSNPKMPSNRQARAIEYREHGRTSFAQPLRETLRGRAQNLAGLSVRHDCGSHVRELFDSSLHLAGSNTPTAPGSFPEQSITFLTAADVLAKVKSVVTVFQFSSSLMTSPSHHRSLRNDPKFNRNANE